MEQRNYGMVVAGHDQRRLRKQRQPGHAGPPEKRHLLHQIAALAGPAEFLNRDLSITRLAAVDFSGDGAQMFRVVEPARREKFSQHRKLSWDHQKALCGRGKDKTAATLRILQGKLLREGAAPGHAKHIDLVVPELP